jgi:hypothetical protein
MADGDRTDTVGIVMKRRGLACRTERFGSPWLMLYLYLNRRIASPSDPILINGSKEISLENVYTKDG